MAESERALNGGRSLFVFINTHCDLSCTYCFYTTGYERRDKKNFLSHDVDSLIPALKALNFHTLILTGGDPLNRRDKAETIRLIRTLTKRGFRVIVNTSAAYLSLSDCKELAAAEPHRVDISIDSVRSELHDAQRGRFEDAIAAIRTLSALGITVQTTSVVTGTTAPYLVETLESLRASGAAIQRFQPAFIPAERRPHGQRRPPETLAINEELRVALSGLLTTPAERSYLALWERYWGGGSGNLPMMPFCRMGKSVFVCSADGAISGCFHRPDVILGNIFKDAPSVIENNIGTSPLFEEACPSCVGSHCVSLFDGADNWTSPGVEQATC